MTKEEIFVVVKNSALEILPDVPAERVRLDCQLKDLGANSIDRVEIVTMSLEALGLHVPLVDLAGISDLRGLVDALYEKSRGGAPLTAAMGERVFVTGAGVVCSLGGSTEELLSGLMAGRCGVGLLRDDASAAAGPTNFGAPLRGYSFEASLARLAGLPAPLLERARRCALRATLPVQCSVASALEAWQAAGLADRPVDPERVGVVVAGDGSMQRLHYEAFTKYVKAPDYLSPRYALQGLETDHVGTLSEVFQVHGEGFVVGGASASGNVALIKAAQALEFGLLDACLVVGALSDLSPVALQGFCSIGALGGRRPGVAPEQACRPFDRGHDGFVYGQGGGCVVLEAEASVRRRGARAGAELAGWALRLDGNRLADPSAAGEARVMRECMARAGVGPGQVDYVNAHGSASPLGDEIETQALRAAFGQHLPNVWVNSTKGLVGHCLFSAGVVEAIACVLQIEHGFVHPNLNLVDPIDERCRFCGPAAEPAIISLALSNSFGFGGVNSCIALRRHRADDV